MTLLRCAPNDQFSSWAGSVDFTPRKAVMPARSAATAGSAGLATDLRHRSRDDLRSQPLRRVPRGPLAGRATRRQGGTQALGVGKPGIRVLGQAAEDHGL